MKKLTVLTILLIILISCTKEETMCTLQVTGHNWTDNYNVGDVEKLDQPKDPLPIEPYDTIVDCTKNGYEWTIKDSIIYPNGSWIKSYKYRKIGN